MKKHVCVFSASSDAVDPRFVEAAEEFGVLIGQRGWSLVFGGGTIGLMGAVARGVHRHGGEVIGVIPDKLNRPGIIYETADRLVVTETLRERKAEMDALADAFVALPGGFGTLEEALEVLTLKQLRYHARPVVFLNTLSFYVHLLRHFDYLFESQFVREEHRSLYHVADHPAAAIEYIEAYAAPKIPSKFASGPAR